MDNLGSNAHPRNHPDEPIPFDAEEPIRPDDKPAGVSRAPLNLGGGSGAPAPAAAPTRRAPGATPTPPGAAPRPPGATPTPPGAAPRPPVAAQRAPAPKPVVPRPVPPRPATSIIGDDRIASCKTFFTKLHAGAIEFLDEQITGWLKENPDVVIKKTNVCVGEVAAKKSEPNILIVVWY